MSTEKKPVGSLWCPFCHKSWTTDVPRDGWEYCPHCRGSFSFVKPIPEAVPPPAEGETRDPWQPIETAPKQGKVDLLGKMWAPAFDEFVYARFPDCFWLEADSMTNRTADWVGVGKGYRVVGWMRIPDLIPPAPPTGASK